MQWLVSVRVHYPIIVLSLQVNQVITILSLDVYDICAIDVHHFLLGVVKHQSLLSQSDFLIKPSQVVAT